MSQAGIINTESGPLPPNVPLRFGTDDGNFAVPFNNELDIFGDNVDANFTQGITTITSGGENEEVTILLTNQVRGTASTNGAETKPVLSVDLGSIFGTASSGVYVFEIKIGAFRSIIPAGAGFALFVTVRTNGVTAFLCDEPDLIINKETPLADTNVSVALSGNTFIVNVTGIVGSVISWSVSGDYLYRS